MASNSPPVRVVFTAAGSSVAAVNDNRHWAVVRQLDLHVGSKHARLHDDTGGPYFCYELFVHLVRLSWWGRLNKAGPIALANITQQSELADDQQLSFNVAQSQIHFAV